MLRLNLIRTRPSLFLESFYTRLSNLHTRVLPRVGTAATARGKLRTLVLRT